MMCATKEEINLAFDMLGIDGVEGISWKEMGIERRIVLENTMTKEDMLLVV